MALDLDIIRKNLIARHEALAEEDRLAEAGRAPVTLDQESVGRLSRIDALQVQAMAMAQQRRRQSERAAIDAALRRIDEANMATASNAGRTSRPPAWSIIRPSPPASIARGSKNDLADAEAVKSPISEC